MTSGGRKKPIRSMGTPFDGEQNDPSAQQSIGQLVADMEPEKVSDVPEGGRW
jgi:hypothetical protein